MESSTELELDTFLHRYPMPEGAGKLETFTDLASVNGVVIRLAGIATEFNGECATGSAASLRETPLFRAYMELVERVAILALMQSDESRFLLRDRLGAPSTSVEKETVFPSSPEPTTWRWARSNGVAVGMTWEAAAARARLELIERDRVLRSWYGEFKPEPIDLVDGLVPAALHDLYACEAYSFGAPEQAAVVGFFGSPRNGTVRPTFHGFAARDDVGAATEAAFAESLQSLGFLWDEALPTHMPSPSATPDFHQDFFLLPSHSGRLRAWLQGEHYRYRGILEAPQLCPEPQYVDLTPRNLRSRLFVARAIPAGHVPLAFGSKHPYVRTDAPGFLQVHPIC